MSKISINFIGEVTKIENNCTHLRIYEQYCLGLSGIEAYSHIHIIYWLHKRDTPENRKVLRVIPKRHQTSQIIGVFACRSPSRPNPIGLSTVKLISKSQYGLKVKGLDAMVGTPILDVKPYSPRSESIPDAITPEWLERGSKH
jgi:tRNA-Thr(GGU) m(6)t(6)A37 methyltransferase TsaA